MQEALNVILDLLLMQMHETKYSAVSYYNHNHYVQKYFHITFHLRFIFRSIFLAFFSSCSGASANIQGASMLTQSM